MDDLLKEYFKKISKFIGIKDFYILELPEIIERPAGPKILVFSPHPDDDAIGCGGTLIKSNEFNNEIWSVVLTDGRKGGSSKYSENEIVELRKNETIEASKILGIKKVIFLNEHDTNLKIKNDVVDRVSQILKDFSPNSVFLPAPFDFHRDHRIAFQILAKIFSIGSYELNCYIYETWTPIYPNVIIDISEQIERKIKAIKCHKSQLKHFKFDEKIKNLNAYRTISSYKKMEFAEAYFKIRSKQIVELKNYF
jgi:LmbE family N-acetylglucosaminyl deacetylase